MSASLPGTRESGSLKSPRCADILSKAATRSLCVSTSPVSASDGEGESAGCAGACGTGLNWLRASSQRPIALEKDEKDGRKPHLPAEEKAAQPPSLLPEQEEDALERR